MDEYNFLRMSCSWEKKNQEQENQLLRNNPFSRISFIVTVNRFEHHVSSVKKKCIPGNRLFLYFLMWATFPAKKNTLWMTYIMYFTFTNETFATKIAEFKGKNFRKRSMIFVRINFRDRCWLFIQGLEIAYEVTVKMSPTRWLSIDSKSRLMIITWNIKQIRMLKIKWCKGIFYPTNKIMRVE